MRQTMVITFHHQTYLHSEPMSYGAHHHLPADECDFQKPFRNMVSLRGYIEQDIPSSRSAREGNQFICIQQVFSGEGDWMAIFKPKTCQSDK
jgi:hypothetical protein